MNLFDLHCDTPFECYTKSKDFSCKSLAVNSLSGDMFQKWSQTFAIWIKEETEKPFKFYKCVLKDFRDKLKKSCSSVNPYFSVEGGSVIEGNLDNLYILKNDGISFLTLTWNGENEIAGGCESEKGLTEFGKETIKVLNKLKIGCDLSHINEKSFYSAIDLAEYPLVTHSCCWEIVRHKRNLKNEQIKDIALKNGVIGLCFYPLFVGEDVFEGIYENIYNICNLGFENNICLGSDFDGAKMSASLDCIEKITHLFEYLRGRGIAEPLLNKFFYENAEKYVENLLEKG